MLDVGEANRLYWETDASVAEIAARFDLSRRALYEQVRPLAAGVSCPSCGEGLTFDNRLARQTGQAKCPACGAQTYIEHADASAVPEMGDPATVDPALEEPPPTRAAGDRMDARAYGEAPDGRGGDIRQRAVLLGGAAIAGLALGVAAIITRRRD